LRLRLRLSGEARREVEAKVEVERGGKREVEAKGEVERGGKREVEAKGEKLMNSDRPQTSNLLSLNLNLALAA
jgi:hypothetical protein